MLFIKRITDETVLLFIRKVALGLGAGGSLSDVLNTLSQRNEDARMQGLAESVNADVSSGMSLGESLA